MTSSVSATIAAEVIRRGAHTFGLMGNGNAYFLDALVREGGAFTPVRHEAAAVAAADTAWRVERRIAVASVTFGAGFTNTLTALAEASMHHTPLVLVAGDRPTTGARLWDVDQEAMATAAGARTVTVGVENPQADVARAFDLALAERTPVVLAVPYDLATVPASGSWAMAEQGHPTVEAAPSLSGVVEVLHVARRPLIVAGDGAREARLQAVALANRLDALTATTAIAKGTFAGRNGDLGVCGGFAAPDSAEVIADADVVVVLGAGLNQFTTAFGHAFGAEAQVVQVDRGDAPTNPRVTHFVPGDVAATAQALCDSVAQAEHPEWRRRGSSVAGHDPGGERASDGLLDPRGLFVALNDILPTRKTVVQDGGHFSGWAPMFWTLDEPGRFHMVGTAFQTIGLGLAAALGSVSVRPDELTVLVAGDGGFLMSLADLDSVVRAAKHCLILVVNDSGYGAEVHQYGSRGLEQEPMRIGGVDFSSFAQAVGARGLTVMTHQDLDVVREWVAAGCPGTLLLDARVSPEIVAPYMKEIVTVAAAAEAASRERFAAQ